MSKTKSMTIGSWLDTYLEVYLRPQIRPSSFSIHCDARRRTAEHFPEIEGLPLKNGLTPVRFQEMLNTLAKDYARSTVRNTLLLYRPAYAKAIQNGYCQKNPTDGATVPKWARTKKVNPLSLSEQQLFEASLHILERPDEYALRILLLTGMRLSELRYLHWKNWDRKQRILTISAAKTDAGIRRIPLVPEVCAMLSSLYTINKPKPGDLIFPGKDGNVVHIMHYQHLCNKVSEYAGMPHITPHMLRHTFATRMIEAGADVKSLALIIGHKDVSFTLKTYVKPDESHLANEIMKISSLVKPKEDKAFL